MRKYFLSCYKILFILLISGIGVQTISAKPSVAVLPSDGVLDEDELDALTDKMREAALKVLLPSDFTLLTKDILIKRLEGVENYAKICQESGGCIVQLGKEAQVDYVARCEVSRLGDDLRISAMLYEVSKGGLLGQFSQVSSKGIRDLLDILEARAPNELFIKIPGALRSSRAASLSVPGGISGLERPADYEFNFDKRYLVNLNTEPQGAILSFDGLPISSCPKTPCKAELPEGRIRIVAALEQYETADTAISITSNDNINIRLKPNFGVLEIKPAYSEGISIGKIWNLVINNKAYTSFENRFSPGEYNVKLSHECYEDISFKAGINKGSREVFDMAKNIQLKMGGLDLSAEMDDVPVSEPVFVNGIRVGKTPFIGSVPICAKVEIGKDKEKVEAKLEYKKTVKRRHIMDSYNYRQRIIQQQKAIAEYEEKKKDSAVWHGQLSMGIGVPVMLNSIDTLYSLAGFQIFANAEFFKPKTDFIRLGFNLNLGSYLIEKDAVRKIHPDIGDLDDKGYLFNVGAFARLYPTDAIYLSGGTSFGYYSSYIGETKIGPGIRTMVFPVGAGLILGTKDTGFLLDAQYNIVMLKNSYGGYWSFNIGGKLGRKRMN